MEGGFAGFKWTVCPAAHVQAACSRQTAVLKQWKLSYNLRHGNFRSHSFCEREKTGMVEKHREKSKKP